MNKLYHLLFLFTFCFSCERETKDTKQDALVRDDLRKCSQTLVGSWVELDGVIDDTNTWSGSSEFCHAIKMK